MRKVKRIKLEVVHEPNKTILFNTEFRLYAFYHDQWTSIRDALDDTSYINGNRQAYDCYKRQR